MSVNGSEIDQRWVVTVSFEADPETGRQRSVQRTVYGTREEALEVEAVLKRAAAAWREIVRTSPRRFPFEDLERMLDCRTRTELARRLGIPQRTIYRHLKDGLGERRADELATRAGLHPSEVWAEWWSSRRCTR